MLFFFIVLEYTTNERKNFRVVLMKNYLKALSAALLTAVLCVGGVDAATASRRIDSTSCDTIYTNYYLFLDANEAAFYKKDKLSNITHVNAADFSNNSYQISNFDINNVGYGQVTINRNSGNSSDGITSWSLYDFYDYYFDVLNHNGAYTRGTNSYITHYNYYSYMTGTEEVGKGGLNLRNYPIRTLVNATLDANATITRQSNFLSTPFKLKIDRRYYGYLTDSPLDYNSKDYYLHPAVYYVQYCSSKPKEVKKYTVDYDGNGSNVTNVPGGEIIYDGDCTYISRKEPKREGYEFLGWSENHKDTTGDPDFDPGDKYCGEKGDIYLFAIWKEKEKPVDPIETYYHIYYRANTSDVVYGMPNDATVNTKEDTTISTLVPTRAGYEFLGWNPDVLATTPNSNYRGGSIYGDRKDITLFAVWKEKETTTPIIPDNPQTGITDYLVPFGGVVGASGLGLGVLKKKKFKQF